MKKRKREKRGKLRGGFREYFSLSLRDSSVALAIFAGAAGLCFLLRSIDDTDLYASMIFILAIFLISRFTSGYLYGTVASFLGVLAVNFLFTYPYFEFNFTLSGYPLTIICMLAVAVITSAMTTQIKRHGNLRIAAEKEKTRSNLLRAVFHDLRTPLTSVLGASSTIIENDGTLTADERLKLLTGIKEDSQWLIRMVENLLSITKIDEDASAKIRKTPEVVEEVVSEAVIKFRKRFSGLNVAVRVPDEILIVDMDAILIEQVLINLLENAALHAKGATLAELSVSERGTDAVFEVADDGCGIDEEALPRIFEGYYRKADDNEGDNRRNMGIGLSVCSTIIRAHGGVLTAENKEKGGAVFRFTLPGKAR